jgi:hypothetical protein
MISTTTNTARSKLRVISNENLSSKSLNSDSWQLLGDIVVKIVNRLGASACFVGDPSTEGANDND